MKIDKDIHAKLTNLGKKGETYSNIINRLIEEKKSHQR